jgi:GNAT superfamily N-acetyltransferase
MSAPGPIFRRVGRQDLPAAYWRAFEAIAADARNLLVVAELDRRVVGTLQLTFIPSLTFVGGERAQIEAVHVDGRHRGRGLGGAMLRWAIERARERGCRLVQLTTDKRRPDALRLYESLGFQATHEGLKLRLDDP